MARRRLFTVLPVLAMFSAGAVASYLAYPDVLFGLADRPDPAAALASDDPHLRRAAARALAEQGGARADAIPALTALLDHEADGETRWLAVYALTRMGPAAEPALDRLAFGTRNDPAGRLAASHRPFPGAAAELIALLDHPNAAIRNQARARLRPDQPAAAAAVPLLVAACRKQAEPEPPPPPEPPLVGPPPPADFPVGAPIVILPPDRSFEPDAILVEMGAVALPGVCKGLRESAADPTPAAGRFRALLAHVLFQIGPPAPEAVPLLAAMASADPNPVARRVAALTRRRVDPALIPDLIRELELAGVGNEAWAPLDDLAPHGRAAAAAAPAVARVMHEAKDSWMRFVAARTLAAVGDPDATIAVLTESLGTPHAGSAAAALAPLGRRAAAAGPALAAALRRTDLVSPDRPRIVHALCRVSPPDPDWLADQLLVSGGTDEGAGVAAVLAEIGPPAVPAAARVLATGNAGAKTHAAAALGKIRPVTPEAVAALAAALSDPVPDRRAEAAWALGALGPEAAAAGPDLLRAAREADGPDRAATFRETARVVAPDAVVAAADPTRGYQFAALWAAITLLCVGWLLYRRRTHPAPRAAR
ncbi:MAG: HEAT repeat domain-containing protein [Gemmataceae bacterium]